MSSRYHGRALGELGARAGRGVVDLVVDVRDVVHERRVVAALGSQRRSHMPITNGRALPMWARAYTVGPQKYIRIGPGGAGRSCFDRV